MCFGYYIQRKTFNFKFNMLLNHFQINAFTQSYDNETSLFRKKKLLTHLCIIFSLNVKTCQID